MQKKQIIAILAAAVGIGIVFSLPKVLVDNEKEAVKGAEETVSASDSKSEAGKLMAEKHTHKPSNDEQKKIQDFTKKYYSISDKEKKRIFADSIVKYYTQFHQYDSVAKYSGEIVLLQPTEKNLVSAGDAYMQASDLVSENDKSTYMDKSRFYYQKALDLNAKNLDTKSKLAMTYVTTSTPMKGIALLREVVKEDPANQTAIFNLGYLSMQSGQYAKAVDRFEELIKVNPAHASGTFYLGLSYLELGNKSKANQYFTKAKGLDSDPEFQAIIDSYLKESN
ncbi:tetratricopeptide repeat protein [Cytophaga aurantiaca]|uniref:tetratricopeptide repeat protein n=1 Tax=Cytophaga aurantiaca TaxID=29530 RepID=UPI00037F80B9|nr:tetratricopeptide repeat protein [Cytophaga aurantiaca]